MTDTGPKRLTNRKSQDSALARPSCCRYITRMNDYQLASLVSGLVLLVAVGARYLVSRPSSQVLRDAMLWALIIGAIGIAYGLYAGLTA